MKLIIDIPESIFNTIQADEMISREQLAILQIHILNGTPLDDVKAEIETALAKEGNTDTAKAQAIALSWVLELLDRIGKAESEDKE